MEKKLNKTIYQLITGSYALKGRLMEANNRSEQSIIRWARTEDDSLTLSHNIEIIFKFLQATNNLSDKEELFAHEQAVI